MSEEAWVCSLLVQDQHTFNRLQLISPPYECVCWAQQPPEHPLTTELQLFLNFRIHLLDIFFTPESVMDPFSFILYC